MAFKFAEAYVQFSQRGLTGVQGAISRVSGGFRSAMGVVGGFQGKLAALGVGVSLGAVVKTAATFEQSMSKVEAITGATGKTLEELQNKARELGATTQFSASEAAGGMSYLAQAGFEADQILAALPGTLNLALAGGLGLAEAADIASNALTGFGMAAEESDRVSDVLALTASSANTNVQQLGGAIKFVAPIAAGFGVSIEEAAASIGALSDAGLQGEMAGTGLRKVLSKLGNPTKELKAHMGGLTLQGDGLSAVLEQLKASGFDVADGLEEFGERGGPAIAVLTEAVPKVESLHSKLDGASGAAKTMADTMADNLVGSSKQAMSALADLAIEGGENGILETARGLMDNLTGALRSDFAKDFAAGVGHAVSRVGDYFSWLTSNTVQTFGIVTDAVSSVYDTFDEIWSTFTQGVSIVDTLTGVWEGFISVIGYAVDNQIRAMGQAFEIVTTTLSIVGGVIVKTMSYFGGLWSQLTGGVATVANTGTVLSQLIDVLKEVNEAVFSFVDGFIESLQFMERNVGDIFDGTIEHISMAMFNSYEAVRVFGVNIIEVVSWASENWKTIFEDMLNFTGTVLENIGGNLQEFFLQVQSWLAGDGFNFEWTGLTDGFEALTELPQLTEAAFLETTERLEQIKRDIAARELAEKERQLKAQQDLNQEYADEEVKDAEKTSEEKGAATVKAAKDTTDKLRLLEGAGENIFQQTRDAINKGFKAAQQSQADAAEADAEKAADNVKKSADTFIDRMGQVAEFETFEPLKMLHTGVQKTQKERQESREEKILDRDGPERIRVTAAQRASDRQAKIEARAAKAKEAAMARKEAAKPKLQLQSIGAGNQITVKPLEEKLSQSVSVQENTLAALERMERKKMPMVPLWG